MVFCCCVQCASNVNRVDTERPMNKNLQSNALLDHFDGICYFDALYACVAARLPQFGYVFCENFVVFLRDKHKIGYIKHFNFNHIKQKLLGITKSMLFIWYRVHEPYFMFNVCTLCTCTPFAGNIY